MLSLFSCFCGSFPLSISCKHLALLHTTYTWMGAEKPFWDPYNLIWEGVEKCTGELYVSALTQVIDC